MTARALLVRGLLAGLLAGFAAFLVAHQVGEPHVERAIALEEAGALTTDPATDGHPHADGEEAGHSHGDKEGATVSRSTQRTWGLLTGSVGVGTALGGLVALVSAACAGRLGRLTPGQSTAVVSLVGFVAVALVPFLKYPATPPGVGSGDTIGTRTAAYFAFLVISVAAAVLGTVLATRLHPRHGAYVAVLAGAGAFLVVVATAALVLPTVDELGAFPAGTLWSFRVASLLTLATMWAVIGVAMVGFVGRLHRTDVATLRRRELAASL